ncbi:MAG TPA: cytochrome c oxidase assembly protein [Thermomicrobiales bacterium]|nr:cytochrome c oxidase assembly protein [Thermomicrobiales bacterium]
MHPPLLALVRALPLAHVGSADPTGPLWSDWTLQPSVVLGLFVLLVAYYWAVGPANRRRPGGPRPVSGGQKAAFAGGLAVLFVALGPPLDDWSDHYLLTAHMTQHLLLTLAAPSLLLLGTPGWLLAPLTRVRVIDRAGYWLTRPPVAYLIANGVFVVWHMPALYDAALRHEPIHVLEHGLFVATALLAWWPLLGPLPAWPRLPPLAQCLYLFLWTIPGGIVGAFITFAAPGLYAPYDSAARVFGIDLTTDQQIAGLLMWIATSSLYLLLITVIFFRYAGQEEAKERAGPAAAPAPASSIRG